MVSNILVYQAWTHESRVTGEDDLPRLRLLMVIRANGETCHLSRPYQSSLHLTPLLQPSKPQDTFLALGDEHKMINHLHVVIGGRTTNLDLVPPGDGGQGAFDLHGREPPAQTGAGTFAEQQHLLAHGLDAVGVFGVQPSLGVEPVRVREDRRVALRAQRLAGYEGLCPER